MRIVHLTSSTFFGGPERQMLGLAEHLSADHETHLWSFAEGGRCAEFIRAVREAGVPAVELTHDTPHLRSAVRELRQRLTRCGASVLLTHGYKANLVGRWAARALRIPVVAVSRGWTGESLKVRCYEAVDQAHLRFMDRVVCVSEGQARKVRRCGVPESRVQVIRNAARVEAFQHREPAYAQPWHTWTRGGFGILAAGRLSPEKGFMVLLAAARRVVPAVPNARFIIFGEGPERPAMEAFIRTHQLEANVQLVGFHRDLDGYIPWADLFVLASHTEGLPNVVMEASSAGVPVVATAVGGTPEAVRDGHTGYLVRDGDDGALAERIIALAHDPARRRTMGRHGQAFMQAHFSFAAQARAYEALFVELTSRCRSFALGGLQR